MFGFPWKFVHLRHVVGRIIKTGNVHMNITLSCSRATAVVVEKQEVLHVLSVCL